MATKLGLWNACLTELGNPTLSDTGEAGAPGRALTTVYTRVVNDCLSMGSWNFAMETIQATADTGVTPAFGWPEVFAKPSDWVRTIAVSEDPYFAFPLTDYVDDANFWSANSSPLYFRYVSNDTGLGFELTRWPPTFTRYVELELAHRISPRITQSDALRERIMKDRDRARIKALNQDAMNEAQPRFLPPGSWTQSRGAGGGKRDRGSRSSLTG